MGSPKPQLIAEGINQLNPQHKVLGGLAAIRTFGS
jgi:hypothetical protein